MRSEQDEPVSWPDGTYPIREFARLSGVNPATLRAWERRYGIVKPLRTPKGHRFYNDQHLQDVRRILYWLEQGYPVRQVQLLLNQPASVQSPQEHTDVWSEQQLLVCSSVEQFELGVLDQSLNDGFSHYPVAIYYERALQPALEQLRGHSHGRLFASLLESRLIQRLQVLMHQQQRHASGPRLILSSNCRSASLELLIRACAIGAAGLRVELLDTSLPACDVRLAADALQAQHLWLHWQPAIDSQHPEWQALASGSRSLWLSGCHSLAIYDRPDINDLRRLPLQQQIQSYILDYGRGGEVAAPWSITHEVNDHD